MTQVVYTIKLDKVTKTYNGKSGCMCGCNGDYSLPYHHMIDDANKDTGWNAYNADSVSLKRVINAINKVNKAIADGDQDAGIDFNSGIAWLDNGRRNTVVYFKP